MLKVHDLRVCYGDVPAVHQASFRVEEGEIVSIVGANGAGKTTLLKTIAGLLRPDRGTIEFLEQRIDKHPAHEIARLGISLVPEGRHLFGKLSVEENLLLGAYVHPDPQSIKSALEDVYELFPVLKDRSRQKAETLSGGEQQMLAIGRGLMSHPKLLMLDEPSLGLMPKYATLVFETVERIHEQGVTVLLIEQNVRRALELADRAYVLQTGRIIAEGTGTELLGSELVQKAFLGL